MNDVGELGVATTNAVCGGQPCNVAPIEVDGLTNVVHVSLGYAHGCAIKSDKSLWCWGSNDDGQLGHDRATDAACPLAGHKCSIAPRAVAGMSSADGVAAGGNSTCAWSSGALYCWGNNGSGQLGVVGGSFMPTHVQLPSSVRAAAIGFSNQYGDTSTCAALQDGSAWCWGSNYRGQLGHDPATDPDAGMNSTPTQVAYDDQDAGFANVSAIDVGRAACGLRANALWCWGTHGYALSGDGTCDTNVHFKPSRVALSNVASFVSAYDARFAIDTTGQLWAWGDNSYGEIGKGDFLGTPCEGNAMVTTTPRRVPLPDAVVMVARKNAATLVLLHDGSVWAWGANQYGQLAHAPGVPAGDQSCPAFTWCNPTPGRIAGLP